MRHDRIIGYAAAQLEHLDVEARAEACKALASHFTHLWMVASQELRMLQGDVPETIKPSSDRALELPTCGPCPEL